MLLKMKHKEKGSSLYYEAVVYGTDIGLDKLTSGLEKRVQEQPYSNTKL